MSDPDLYIEFRETLKATREPTVALSLIADSTKRLSTLESEVCESWLAALARDLEETGDLYCKIVADDGNENRDEDEPTWGDVLDSVARLVEAFMNRLQVLRVEIPLKAVDRFIRDLYLNHECILNVPRSYLMRAYPWWIEDCCTPIAIGYARQYHEKATPMERVEVTSKYAGDKDPDREIVGEILIERNIEVAMRIAPEYVRPWIDILKGDADESLIAEFSAIIDYYEEWLRRADGSADVPASLLRLGTTFEKEVADEAKRDLEGSSRDTWRVSTGFLKSLTSRIARMADPESPVEACSAAAPFLRSYLQLQMIRDREVLVDCALLTLAIEAQTRWALSQDLNEDDCMVFSDAGLAKLAAFVSGSRCKEIPSHLKVKKCSPKLRNFLRRAGSIRNNVHHNSDLVRAEDLDELRRALFDTDKGAPQMLRQVAGIRTCDS